MTREHPGRSAPGITRREVARMPDGRALHEYTLDNSAGMTLSAINLGGIVTSIYVPDRAGHSASVVLGLPTLADFLMPPQRAQRIPDH
jgi:aldose 1-epimerase